MHIREASQSDFNDFKELQRQFHQVYVGKQPFSGSYELEIEEYGALIQNKKVFLVEDDGEVMGYTILQIKESENAKTVAIDEICIDEPHRGQGIGNFLFGKAVLYAKSIMATGLELDVWEFNQSAIAFYENMGMKTKARNMELSL